MKQIAIFLILILFSCKGQSVDTLEEIKNEEPITIEILGQKPNTDSLSVIIVLPKKYILKSNKKLKLLSIDYYKLIYNKNNNAIINLKNDINLKDTIQFNIEYFKLIHPNQLNSIENNNKFKKNIVYKVSNKAEVYKLLTEFKKDDIRFRYYHENDLKNIIAKSIPLNLE